LALKIQQKQKLGGFVNAPGWLGASVSFFSLLFYLFFFLPGNVERDLTWLLKFVLGLAWNSNSSASTGQELRLEHHTIASISPALSVQGDLEIGETVLHRILRFGNVYIPSPRTWGGRSPSGEGEKQKRKGGKGNTFEKGAFSMCGLIGC